MTQGQDFPWHGTHPFIDFDFRFIERIPATTWTLLGECSSKIEHVSGTPLRDDTAEEFQRVFLAKGVHATTAIEGNTLSEEQVRKRLGGELALPASQEYLGREIDNILDAYNHVIGRLEKGVPFTLAPDDLKMLNRMVLQGLTLEDHVMPGEYRQDTVTVSDYLAPPAQFVTQMVAEGCRWLNHDDWGKTKGARFVVPLLRAIISHLYIAWIHPFGDGNGRTARVIEFDLLIRAGVPFLCAHVLSDHYNRTRNAYYKALSAARATPVHFIMYAVDGLCDSLKEQITLIRKQHTEVTWINYVHTIFQADQSAQSRRQRRIALALAEHNEPVSVDKIPNLTPQLAVAYSQLTPRTLYRDIRRLVRRRLLVASPTGLRANIDLVRAFMPFTEVAKVPADQAKTPAA